jgi:hypothetical protein
MEKRCSGCKETLSLDQFYKNKTNEDGKSIYCKECTKLNAKKYYQKKLLKQVSETGGLTINQTIFPNNFINLGDHKAEIALKIVMIQRMTFTINNELNDLNNLLHKYSEEKMTM